jgi:signal transduction histidine kinase
MDHNEDLRIKALHQYGIIDSTSEGPFEDLAMLAAYICGSPYCVIGFFDRERYWVKSSIGITLESTSDERDFFSVAVLDSGNAIEVPNTLIDPRFQTNMLVANYPSIRSYVAVPLIDSTGLVLGSICVMDSNPRRLTNEQSVGLHVVANQVLTQLEMLKINKSQQKMLFQYSKLIELGQFVTEIAHEINTPLAIVNSNTSVIRGMSDNGTVTKQDISKFADGVEKNVLRISKIVNGLRRLGRNATHDPFEPYPIKMAIEDALDLCRKRLSGEGIELYMDPINQCIIDCRPTQITQVILNLINNAFDAIKDIKGKWIRITFIDGEDEIQIKVTDCGAGIPAEIQKQMFDNFFTTKAAGEGTGIGLTISSSIIGSHNGKLSIDSTAENTTFVITLPRHQEQGLMARRKEAA